MSNSNQLNENTRDGLDVELPKTRPIRHRLAPMSQLRMQFEGLCDELEELLRHATSNSDSSVMQVLQNIDSVHASLFATYLDLKRSLSHRGAINEQREYADVISDMDEKVNFVVKKLRVQSEVLTSLSSKSKTKKSEMSKTNTSSYGMPESSMCSKQPTVENYNNEAAQYAYQPLREILDTQSVHSFSHYDAANVTCEAQCVNERHDQLDTFHGLPVSNIADVKPLREQPNTPTSILSPMENINRFFNSMPPQPPPNQISVQNARHNDDCRPAAYQTCQWQSDFQSRTQDAVIPKQNNQQLNPQAPVYKSVSSPHDVVPRLLMKKEAFTAPKQPFNGKALEYKHWEMKMRRFIDTFELSPDETLDLLELAARDAARDHTRDAALTTVSRFHIAAGFDPEQAVEKQWKELSCRFGSSARIAKALQDKLHGLPAIGTDMTKFSDFHNECEIVLLHMDHVSNLAVLNYTQGLAPLFHKLPQFIRNKWQSVVYRYSTHEHDKHPPFAEFCKFLAEQVQTFSNTLSLYQNHADNMKTTKDKRIFKSDVPTSFNQAAPSNQPTCPLHKIRSNHTLTNCREFQKLNVGSRLDIIKENKLCFRCFEKHHAKDCNSTESFRECKSERHHYLLHSNRRTLDATAGTGINRNAGATSDSPPDSAVPLLAAACTKLCGRNQPTFL